MWMGSGRAAGLACALMAFALVDQPDSAAAAPLTALGPEVAVGKPSNGYVGRLDVMPEHAPAGAPVTLKAEGLPPGQEFQFVWVTVNGEWKVANAEYHGREFTPVAYEITKAKSDAAGRLSVTFTAPDDYGFLHDIVLQQGGRLFTQVAFNLDMSVDISPEEWTARHADHGRRQRHRLPLAL